tara:strand:+ start:633 stop:1361 length:729 start_codon:yes stop_codon:yes gene_type:complete
MNDFKSGFVYLLSGFTLILKPKVRFYSLTPLFLNILLFLLLFFYSYSKLDEIISVLELQWQWLGWVSWIIWVIFFIAISILIFFCFSILGNLISAPFNNLLSRAVELELLGKNIDIIVEQSMQELIIDSFKSEYRKIIYFFLRILILLSLFFIPVVNIITPFIWFIFSIWMFAIEYCDFPMSNHNIQFSRQLMILSKKRFLVCGFGLGVLTFILLPIINLIIIPVSVAGATKMYIESIKSEL